MQYFVVSVVVWKSVHIHTAALCISPHSDKKFQLFPELCFLVIKCDVIFMNVININKHNILDWKNTNSHELSCLYLAH